MGEENSTTSGKQVTQKDIAERCGVCVMTVSCALRGDRKMVSQKTMQRIREVAREMGYRQDLGHAARRLKYTHSDEKIINHVVGIDIGLDATNSPYFTRLLGTISKVFYRADFALLAGWGAGTAERSLPLIFRRGDVDGVFNVAGVENSLGILGKLRAEPGFGGRPVVSILEPLADCPAVIVDDRAAARLLGAHLLGMGHRALLYPFSPFGSGPGHQRLEGIRELWREEGLGPESRIVPIEYSNDPPDVGLGPALFAKLEERPDIRVIFAGNDGMAVRIWELLRGHGIRVPDDISLVGFDDTHAILDPEGKNILTTVHLPIEEAAEQAANMLLALIRGETLARPTVVLPTELVVRSSVARACPQ